MTFAAGLLSCPRIVALVTNDKDRGGSGAEKVPSAVSGELMEKERTSCSWIFPVLEDCNSEQ